MEVPSQKIAYLDNNGVVSTLAKDQPWQRETHYKTMADWLPAWLAVRSRGAAMLLFVWGGGGENETETHIIIISLFIAINTGVNDWSQSV